jgi:hypothetical protein
LRKFTQRHYRSHWCNGSGSSWTNWDIDWIESANVTDCSWSYSGDCCGAVNQPVCFASCPACGSVGTQTECTGTTIVESDTLRYATTPGATCNWYEPFADQFLTPDTVSAALARGTSTPGTLCKTQKGTIGSTSRGAKGTLSISNATAVVATLSCSGLVSGCNYEVTITLKRYTAGGGGYVDSITDTIAFTASGATEDIDYDVPVNTDYDYEMSAATIAEA